MGNESYSKLSYRQETRATHCISGNVVSTVIWITQTDRVSAWGVLSATAACIVFTFVHKSLH